MDRRWDDDECGHGVGDARDNLPAIRQLAEFATHGHIIHLEVDQPA